MKYKTIGAFKNVQNVPYCKAKTDMRVGMGVILDKATKLAALPQSDEEAKKVVYIVSNINDKPEIRTSYDGFAVLKDEFVRADDLRTVNGMEIELAGFEIDGGTESVSVGDTIVFTTNGLLKKTSDASEYAVSFKVLEKTAYMDDGILAEIISL